MSSLSVNTGIAVPSSNRDQGRLRPIGCEGQASCPATDKGYSTEYGTGSYRALDPAWSIVPAGRGKSKSILGKKTLFTFLSLSGRSGRRPVADGAILLPTIIDKGGGIY